MSIIAALQSVILQLHGCEAEHVQTIPVREIFEGQVIWDGEVELFAIKGHPSGAVHCFAWAYHDAGTTHYTTVLQLPPVLTPQDAVKAALVAKVKNERKET